MAYTRCRQSIKMHGREESIVGLLADPDGLVYRHSTLFPIKDGLKQQVSHR